MKMKMGARMKAIRELTGLTRDAFVTALKLDLTRYKNVEYLRCRVGEEEVEKVGEHLPELLEWLAFEGDIEVQRLANSPNQLSKIVAARVNAGIIPEGYHLEERLKY